jgi:hypothetical protein
LPGINRAVRIIGSITTAAQWDDARETKEKFPSTRHLPTVMAGLGPATHVFLTTRGYITTQWHTASIA